MFSAKGSLEFAREMISDRVWWRRFVCGGGGVKGDGSPTWISSVGTVKLITISNSVGAYTHFIIGS